MPEFVLSKTILGFCIPPTDIVHPALKAQPYQIIVEKIMIIKTNFPLSPMCLARLLRSRSRFGFVSNSGNLLPIASLLKKRFLENCYHSAVVDKKQALNDCWFLTQAIKIKEKQSCLSYKTSQSAGLFKSAITISSSAVADFS